MVNRFGIGIAAAAAWLYLGCAYDAPEQPPVETAELAAKPASCGGLAAIACDPGFECVDKPGDGCTYGVDPDCDGKCVRASDGGTPSSCHNELRDYVSTDYQSCLTLRFECDSGYAFFDEDCGCGCINPPDYCKSASLCPEPAPLAPTILCPAGYAAGSVCVQQGPKKCKWDYYQCAD